MLKYWLLIGLLAICTYVTRAIGIELMAGKKMNNTVRLYLNLVPIAIMVALIMKQMIAPVNGQLTLSLPVLISCLATMLAFKLFKSFLPSFAIGIIFGMCTRYFI